MSAANEMARTKIMVIHIERRWRRRRRSTGVLKTLLRRQGLDFTKRFMPESLARWSHSIF